MAQTEEHYDIRILKDGTWLYNGTPIGRKNLVRLFSSVLKIDENGDYWLITPAERGRIDVDDVPFLAVITHLDRSVEILMFRMTFVATSAITRFPPPRAKGPLLADS